MWTRMIRALWWNGLTEEDWKKVYPALAETNRNALRRYSLTAIFLFGTALGLSYVVPAMMDKRPVYILCTAGGIAAFLLERLWLQKKKELPAEQLSAVICAFVSVNLGGGAYMSLGTSRTETAVLLPVMFSLVPLLFMDHMLYTILLVEIINVLYIGATLICRPESIRALEIVNSVIFSSMGLVIGYYMTGVKMERHLYAANMTELIRLRNRDALTDQLTGLPNRRAYYEELKHIAEAEDLVTACADINALKQINDTFGHESGDVLICGAGEVLRRICGKYGSVYRMGGDEFQLLLRGDPGMMERLTEELRCAESAWSQDRSFALHLAIGYCCRKEEPGLTPEEMSRRADQRMYEYKASWYRTSGLDRRRR